MWVWSLCLEEPLEEEMASHSSILAWRIPWMEEPGGLQSKGSQRGGLCQSQGRDQTERRKETASHLPTLYIPILEMTAGSLATWGLISSHQSQGLKVEGSSLPTSPSLARPEGDH